MLFLPPGIAFLLSELLKFNLKPTASPYQTLPLPQENPVSPGVNSSSSYVSLLGLSSLPVCVCYFCPCIFSTTWLDSLGVGAWLHHLTVEATAVVLDPYLRDSSRALLNEQVSDSTLEQQHGGTNPGCLGRESASRVTVNSEEGMNAHHSSEGQSFGQRMHFILRLPAIATGEGIVKVSGLQRRRVQCPHC